MISETSAIFQAHRKIPLVHESFIIDVITGRVAGRLSLITRAGILSIPGDLFNGIDWTTSATCEQTTGLKLNYWLVSGAVWKSQAPSRITRNLNDCWNHGWMEEGVHRTLLPSWRRPTFGDWSSRSLATEGNGFASWSSRRSGAKRRKRSYGTNDEGMYINPCLRDCSGRASSLPKDGFQMTCFAFIVPAGSA